MFLSGPGWPEQSPVDVVVEFAEGCQKEVVRLGYLHTADGWRASRGNKENGRVLHAALYVAACCLHVTGCVGIRIGAGVRCVEAADFDASLFW